MERYVGCCRGVSREAERGLGTCERGREQEKENEREKEERSENETASEKRLLPPLKKKKRKYEERVPYQSDHNPTDFSNHDTTMAKWHALHIGLVFDFFSLDFRG